MFLTVILKKKKNRPLHILRKHTQFASEMPSSLNVHPTDIKPEDALFSFFHLEDDVM